MPTVIRTTTNRFNRTRENLYGSSSNGWLPCSPVFCGVWSFVVLWIGFLFYCYYYGLIDNQKINTLVHNVDLVINQTETNLLRGKHSISFTHAIHPLKIPDGVTGAVSSTGLEETIPTASPDDVYVIFSTDCTPYQDWQTLVLFHSAKRVRQKGHVIRIASGCSEEKQKQLTDLYNKLYHGYYYAHFTPDFKKDAKTKKKCKKNPLRIPHLL